MKLKEWLNFRTIIIVFFILWLARIGNTIFGVNRINVSIRYAKVAQKYLEEKYGESFYVEPQYHDPRSKLILEFDVPTTCYFYAYPLSDEDYKFNVYITKKEKNYKIKAIRDDYCWKNLRPQLQQYTEDYFSDVLGNEMKVVRVSGGITSASGFPAEITQESTLEDYFASSETPYMSFEIFVPSCEGVSTEMIEKKTLEFASELLNIRGFSTASYIIVCYPNESEVYETIDTSIEKRSYVDKKELTYLCSISILDLMSEGMINET